LADEASKQSLPNRLPLVVGVTGHCDLRDEDIPKLREAVDEIFVRLKRDYGLSPRWPRLCRLCRARGLRRLCQWLGLCRDPETPIIVLSALAEGADRLVADIAIKHGAKLIAPLPVPADEYRQDFVHDQTSSIAEFNHLLARALHAPEMPYPKGSSLEAIRKDPEKRDLQYRAVGVFIVRHCHVLIALWNRDEANTAPGGTTEVVKFKRDGIPLDLAETARASLDAPEIGPVIYVDTPRAKGGGNVTSVAIRPWGREIIRKHRGGWVWRAWRYLGWIAGSLVGGKRPSYGKLHEPPSNAEKHELRAWETFAVQTEMTRQFNDEAAALARARDSEGRLRQSQRYLFDDSTDTDAGPTRAHPADVVPRWCGLYTIADTLALERQKQFLHDWGVLFVLGFVAIVAFEVVTHLFHELTALYVAYAMVFLLVFGYMWYSRHYQHQERYLDYRALAEALRVAVFWKLLGIGLPPSPEAQHADRESRVDLSSGESVADAYPIRQPRELDWIKTCLRAVELIDERTPHQPAHRPETDGYRYAHNWVKGQRDFFTRRGPDHDHRADVLEIRSVALLLTSMILAATLFVSGQYFGWEHREFRYGTLIFFVGLAAALAAIFAGRSEKLALNAQARQYDRMRALFERAYDILPQEDESKNFRQMQALFAELGAEAMKENAAWVEIYRQRPIRAPQG
jgi:hypothetical protein